MEGSSYFIARKLKSLGGKVKVSSTEKMQCRQIHPEYRLKMLGGRVEGGRMEGGRVKGGRVEGGRAEGRRVEGWKDGGWMGGRVEGEEGGGIKLFDSKETQELGWKSQSKHYPKNSLSPNSYPE